jgi:DNA anti-recombination protein RmuC
MIVSFQKETRIADLETQLEATREETNNSLIDKLTKISETHHQKTQDKIKELYSIHKRDLKEFAEQQHQSQVTGLKDAQQHLKELGKIQEIQLKDSNTKFVVCCCY